MSFFVVGEIVQDYTHNLKRIAADQDYPVLSSEAFVGILDIGAVLWESLWKQLKLKEKLFFEEINITYLVQSELEECFYSTKFLENLLSYRKTRKLAKQISFKNYLYTFEKSRKAIK